MPIKVISLSEQEVASVEDVAALQQQLASLESRVAYLEAKPPVDPDPDPPPNPDPPPDPLPPPEPPPGENNIDRIRAAGHPCPPLEQWWVGHPTPHQIKDLLVPAMPVTEGVRRIWLPRDFRPGETVDEKLLKQMTGDGLGPQQNVLYAYWQRHQGDEAGARASMARGVERYREQPFQGRIYSELDAKRLWSRLLSLDWIWWADADEYEEAFEAARAHVEAEIANSVHHGRDWRTDGYFNATHMSGTGWFIRTLLALHAYGVNPGGPAHAWADSQIDKIGLDPRQHEDANWSPWVFVNQLQLTSRSGGGTEYGHGTKGVYGLGGYEQNFAIGAASIFAAVDSALGTTLGDNLYSQTRHVGLILEANTGTRYLTDGGAAVRAMARQAGGEAGKRLIWVEERESSHGAAWRELQACLGPPPAAEAPPSEPFAGRVGSHFHYRDDWSKPDSTFRVTWSCRDVDCFRFPPEERVFWFMIGSVGLIDARANRGGEVGAMSNGLWFGPRDTSGGPRHIDAQGWPKRCSVDIYHTHDRATVPEEMLADPKYIVGDASGPVLQNGVWRWNLNLVGRIGEAEQAGVPTVGKGVTGPCHTQFTFDPAARRLEMVDTVSVSSPYVGWHFSPTHEPVFRNDGFDVSDGSDTVRVTIESADGTPFLRTERRNWSIDGKDVFLDYHGRQVAMNVGYEPAQRKPTHQVRTIVEAA